jgi:hypothetical protein
LGIEGVLLVLAGFFVAFWGQSFIRLAVGLFSGLWLGWIASTLTTYLLGGHTFTSFLAGLVVFSLFFVLGLIKYRFIASFFLSSVITYYLPLENIIGSLTGNSLSEVQLILLRLLVFLGLLIITYTAFKLLIGLITSSLGSLLLYIGLIELGTAQTIASLITAILFLTSLTWYLLKRKK